MTNSEAVKAIVSVEVQEATVTKALVDASLIPGDIYTKEQEVRVAFASVDVLSSLLYSSVSEGGYSVSFDRRAIEQKINFVCGKYGIVKPGPSVKGVTPW